jgi:hypothetical protein
MAESFVYFCISTRKTTETAQKKQRAVPLFSQSPNRWLPRISAENAMSLADNLVQKQQKQQNNGNYPPPAARLRIL